MQEMVYVNQRTEAYLKSIAMPGETVRMTAGRVLREIAAKKKGVSG